MTYLILIRHGETPWTKVRRFQGSTDTELTKHGKRQARAIGKCLKHYKIDTLYCSPLKRAKQTAAAIGRALGKKINYDKRLRELGYGIWEGKSAAELLSDKKSRYEKWSRGKIVTPQGGEKMPLFRKRVGSMLKEIVRKHSGKKIAIITHGGPVKMFLYEALKLPFRSLWSFRIETASMTVIGLGKHYAQVFTLNDSSHLPRPLRARPDYLG